MSFWSTVGGVLVPFAWKKRKQIRDEAANIIRSVLANPAATIPDVDHLFEQAVLRASDLVGHKLKPSEARWVREELGRIGILRESARLRAEAFKLLATLERAGLGEVQPLPRATDSKR